MNENELPHFTLTDTPGEFEQAEPLCQNSPVILEYHHRKLVMMPYQYFLEQFCTPEEREKLESGIHNFI